jgi:hypothetical protein
MVLTVYRSNRAELLAQLLATQLQVERPDPFEQVQVLVNTWPTSRWLGERLADGLGGIAANLRFPFPGAHLRQLVRELLGEALGFVPDSAVAPPRAGSFGLRTLENLANFKGAIWPVNAKYPKIGAHPEVAKVKVPTSFWVKRFVGFFLWDTAADHDLIGDLFAWW